MKIIDIYNKKKTTSPPIWFMRQAGRYLPEYNETKKKAGSFLDLCFTPELASEVTLQPLKRFDLDCAIIFSDILVIPHAMGYELEFKPEIGPILKKVTRDNLVYEKPEKIISSLGKIYEAINITRNKLEKEKALIGFCGAPFTIALYMLFGQMGKSKEEGRKFLYQDPEFIKDLINILTDYIIHHLHEQYKAGSDILMLFDSWAGVLAGEFLQDYSIDPIKKIAQYFHKREIPFIYFPRKTNNILLFEDIEGILATDIFSNVSDIQNMQKRGKIIQTGPDPFCLFADDEIIYSETKKIMDNYGKYPFIFNLSHGINKDTKIEKIEKLIEYVRLLSNI